MSTPEEQRKELRRRGGTESSSHSTSCRRCQQLCATSSVITSAYNTEYWNVSLPQVVGPAQPIPPHWPHSCDWPATSWRTTARAAKPVASLNISVNYRKVEERSILPLRKTALLYTQSQNRHMTTYPWTEPRRRHMRRNGPRYVRRSAG